MKRLVGIWALFFGLYGAAYLGDWTCSWYYEMAGRTYTGIKYVTLIPLVFYALVIFLALLRKNLCAKDSTAAMKASLFVSAGISVCVLALQYMRPGNGLFHISIAPLLLFMTGLFSLAEMRSKGEK